jgi:hypothetical protein
MGQPITSSSFSDWKPEDLKDPQLFKVNSDVGFLFSKVGTFFTPGGTPTYPTSPTFTALSLNGQTTPPTDPTAVLTLASANALFAPSAQRAALLSGGYPATGQQQQPLPSGSSSGNGGSGATYSNVSSGVTLGASPLTVATVTPTQAGTYLVTAVVVFTTTSSSGQIETQLLVGGTPQTGVLRFAPAVGTAFTKVSYSRSWIVTLASGGTPIAIETSDSNGTTGATVAGTDSELDAVLL